ncbi:glycosyltransferase family 4 protein [Candidatus Pristimantibacillus sp. PTI5]|uniref:glycosyltransferase family 4 protein n=1 Tax=Candidatus Pristimantibacillus sp. PTI5 TaxID=3400422 RepID=UPI003B028EAD
MRLFFVGDFRNNNGPASVNKSLKIYMPENTLYSEEVTKLKKIIELVIKTLKADLVLFSGLTRINIIGFVIAKILGKKSAYLMHGSNDFEGKINNLSNKKDVEIEKKVLSLTPKIICVSEYFMNWMIETYPQYKSKLTFVNNGVDWDMVSLVKSIKIKRERNCILSVGGGMPRKNILSICRAIDYLNKEKEKNLKLIVIGKNAKDTEAIKSYSFVQYIEEVNKDEMIFHYKKAQLFIQNSIFDTFGLAPVEALLCGCDLLISKNVGSKSIISDIQNNDTIHDTHSISELSAKIDMILKKSNNNRLINSIDKKETTIQSAVNKLLAIYDV